MQHSLRLLTVGALVGIIVLLGSVAPSQAGRGVRGPADGHHVSVHRVFVGCCVFIGPPVVVRRPVYGFPDTPPVVVEPQPVYVQQSTPQQYWYYCQNPPGYYPYVQQCPGGWLEVVPN
jgi:hypothetical protein